MKIESRNEWVRGEMEYRKNRVLNGEIKLDTEAEKNFLGICDMINWQAGE